MTFFLLPPVHYLELKTFSSIKVTPLSRKTWLKNILKRDSTTSPQFERLDSVFK